MIVVGRDMTGKLFIQAIGKYWRSSPRGCMKNKKSAMISCSSGFRPVSFLLEALEENAE